MISRKATETESQPLQSVRCILFLWHACRVCPFQAPRTCRCCVSLAGARVGCGSALSVPHCASVLFKPCISRPAPATRATVVTAGPAPANRAKASMGKKRRRRRQRRANVTSWWDSCEEEQQQHSLDAQRQKELRFECVNHSSDQTLAQTLRNLQAFCSQWGPVADVHQVSNGKNPTAYKNTAVLRPTSGRYCGDGLSRGCSQDPAAAAASDALQQKAEPLHTSAGSTSTCQRGVPALQQLLQLPWADRPALQLSEVLQVSVPLPWMVILPVCVGH